MFRIFVQFFCYFDVYKRNAHLFLKTNERQFLFFFLGFQEISVMMMGFLVYLQFIYFLIVILTVANCFHLFVTAPTKTLIYANFKINKQKWVVLKGFPIAKWQRF